MEIEVLAAIYEITGKKPSLNTKIMELNLDSMDTLNLVIHLSSKYGDHLFESLITNLTEESLISDIIGEVCKGEN